jgi:trehalose synthase-fused probable maltokinase
MSDTDDAAFRPERISERDIATWRSGMTTHIHSLFSQLRSLPAARQADFHLDADQLTSLETSCLNVLDDLQILLANPIVKIRVHGDYHLGQILKTGDAFIILDFEGEPARTLDERRAKQCALKDVAGMRRSFHYAGHAARRELQTGTSGDTQLTDIWARLASEAFWEGYTGVAKPGEAPFLPGTLDEATKVLRIFELDKTVYEIGYELNHRPDWLPIPLEGLRRMFMQQEKTV